jgi:hypothetical protein
MKKISLFSAIVAVLVLIMIEPSFSTINNGMFFSFEEDYLEPLFFGAFFTFGLSIYLLFFNQAIQLAWWRWARWFMVWIGFLVLISGGGTGGFTIGGPGYMATLWFTILSLITFIYTLYHRFYLKTGVSLNN